MIASTRPKAGEEDLVTPKWEDPPNSWGRRPIDWAKILEPLRTNPNRWARVATYESRSGVGTAAKRARELVGADFEIVTRTVDGGSAMFARFVGAKK